MDVIEIMAKASFEHVKKVQKPPEGPTDAWWQWAVRDEQRYIVAALDAAGYQIIPKS